MSFYGIRLYFVGQIAAVTVAICCFFLALSHIRPISEATLKASLTLVECHSHYELRVNGKPAMYLDQLSDSLSGSTISFSADSIPHRNRYLTGQWTYRSALLPICNGTLVVADVLKDEELTVSEYNKHIASHLAAFAKSLAERSRKAAKKADELDYYLRVHNILDEGYNTIADYAATIRAEREVTDSALHLISSISPRDNAEIVLVATYTLLHDTNGSKERISCHNTGLQASPGLRLLQTRDSRTPKGAAPLFLRSPFAQPRFRPASHSVSTLFDHKGRFTGHATITDTTPAIYSGHIAKGQKSGYGTAIFPKDKSRLVGKWSCDTVTGGILTTPTSRYSGHLDSRLRPSGYGTLSGPGGSFYAGEWLAGKRHGFGWGVDTAGNIKAGEWKSDRYCGERLLYTSDRIYGIDISRHQHEKGRKRYSINWRAIRITNLGKISNKRVSGAVDYPVSFVYIKSTEGTTIRNRYYAADYTQARANGIRCGAYHFFSLKSDAVRQAEYFLRNSRFSKGDFPPVLDVEPSPRQILQAGGTDKMFRMIRSWLSTVHKRTGVRPILYVSQQFVNKYLPLAPDIMSGYKVWIARYGEYKPDVRLVFWQLCPDGKVSGIHGDVDINVFNGYQDAYDHFLENDRIK